MVRQQLFKGIVEGIATSNVAGSKKFTLMLNEKIEGIPQELAADVYVRSPWVMIRKDDELVMELEIFTEHSKFWDQDIFYAICHACFNKNLQTG